MTPSEQSRVTRKGRRDRRNNGHRGRRKSGCGAQRSSTDTTEIPTFRQEPPADSTSHHDLRDKCIDRNDDADLFCSWADGFYAQYPRELNFPAEIRRKVTAQVKMFRRRISRVTAMHLREDLMQEAWLGWVEGQRRGWDETVSIRHALRRMWCLAQKKRRYAARHISGLIDDQADSEMGEQIQPQRRPLHHPGDGAAAHRFAATGNPRDHRHHPSIRQVLDDLDVGDERHRRILELIGQGWTQTEVAYEFGVTRAAINRIIRKNADSWFTSDAPVSLSEEGDVSDAA